MMKTLLAAATLAMLSAPAFAQQPTTPAQPQPATEDKFTKHDADKNGALTIDEVQAADATVTTDDFAKADADADKALSKDEFAKWAEAKATPPVSAPGQ